VNSTRFLLSPRTEHLTGIITTLFLRPPISFCFNPPLATRSELFPLLSNIVCCYSTDTLRGFALQRDSSLTIEKSPPHVFSNNKRLPLCAGHPPSSFIQSSLIDYPPSIPSHIIFFKENFSFYTNLTPLTFLLINLTDIPPAVMCHTFELRIACFQTISFAPIFQSRLPLL